MDVNGIKSLRIEVLCTRYVVAGVFVLVIFADMCIHEDYEKFHDRSVKLQMDINVMYIMQQSSDWILSHPNQIEVSISRERENTLAKLYQQVQYQIDILAERGK